MALGYIWTLSLFALHRILTWSPFHLETWRLNLRPQYRDMFVQVSVCFCHLTQLYQRTLDAWRTRCESEHNLQLTNYQHLNLQHRRTGRLGITGKLQQYNMCQQVTNSLNVSCKHCCHLKKIKYQTHVCMFYLKYINVNY